MSEEKNPFTEKPSAADPAPGASRPAWFAAAILGVFLVAALAFWASQARSLASLRRKLDEAGSALANSLSENQQDKARLAALQSQLADLGRERDLAAQRANSLENEMRSALESRDVTISNLQGKLTVNILDRVMFDSGEAVLQPDGEAVLRKIAAVLADHPGLKIHVIGHTDNVPIHGRFASNWELSTARALAAVHFLTEKAGVDPRSVGAVGYGEYRPIADNATPEGRAKNRRIAITILPDELAGSDTVPTAKTNAPLDSPIPPNRPDAPAAGQN